MFYLQRRVSAIYASLSKECLAYWVYISMAFYRRGNAVSVLSSLLNETDDAALVGSRSLTAPFTIFNNATGFMEARNASGAWTGPDPGWTEGDKWVYTFDVVHDVPGLVERKGGNASFVRFLDEHFDGGEQYCFPFVLSGSGRHLGHNDYRNEVNPCSSNHPSIL